MISFSSVLTRMATQWVFIGIGIKISMAALDFGAPWRRFALDTKIWSVERDEE